LIIPVEISVYSYTPFLKHLPSVLLANAAKIKKGSATPNRVSGIYNKAQLEEIANIKLPDLNTTKVSSAMKIVEEQYAIWYIHCRLSLNYISFNGEKLCENYRVVIQKFKKN
jgi:hypothetical protein